MPQYDRIELTAGAKVSR